jgi:predicted dienelactone hydrolase
MTTVYDPFDPGDLQVGVRAIDLRDPSRGRTLPVEIWYPTGGTGRDARSDVPVVVYSHPVAGTRRSATFLATHLASHGYAVAALDHSEVVEQRLPLPDSLTDAERAAQVESIIVDRVPDVRLLLDHLADALPSIVDIDVARVGLIGHSFGGWTVLATADVDERVAAVVALAPGGASRPRPGVLPLTLTFDRRHDVPTLFLAAEHDVPIPPDAVRDVYDRAPGSKRMLILRNADHQHFVDEVERDHEAFRSIPNTGPAGWMPAAMRPYAELCTAEEAHAFVRGLALAHFDATLRKSAPAREFLAGDLERELTAKGVGGILVR